MDEQLYATLNKAWNSTCRVLFGDEIGELKTYEPWLAEFTTPLEHSKSILSGKDVCFMPKIYANGSKWASFDEIDFSRKFEPLNINEIKDIDSLVDAVSERVCYAGNVVLGNSGEVQESSQINDSFFVDKVSMMGELKYVSNCTLGRLAENCFGCYGAGESEFCIRCSQTYREKRCFEVWMSQNCSDSYYCYNINHCSECIFCFNIKNRRNCVGNLVLEASKYRQISEKLIEEIVQGLKKKKKLPSLVEISNKSEFRKPKFSYAKEEVQDVAGIKRVVEEEFSKTTGILFGKPLRGVDAYAKWLGQHVQKMEVRTSAASKAKIPFSQWLIGTQQTPPERSLTAQEAQAFGQTVHIDAQEAQTLTLENAHERIGKLAFFNLEFLEGTNRNLAECSMCIDSSFGYCCAALVYSKYCAYSCWPRSSEHAFGCEALFDSSFCVNCYHSVKLTRCFELDTCRSCSDCLFCHNCENVHDSMFCFNVKNLRYAIGNVEVGREKYARVKGIVLSQISQKLEKDKKLGIDIYSIGAGN